VTPTAIQLIAAVLFAVAILHTFSTKFFEHLAHTRPAHAGIWHLLSEVEVVFGFWAMLLIVMMFATNGATVATEYIATDWEEHNPTSETRPCRSPVYRSYASVRDGSSIGAG
jgi:amino acid transporter